jgi:hypothetical protein
MAHEITRLSRSLHSAQDRLRLQGLDAHTPSARAVPVAAAKSNAAVAPFDTVLPGVAIKIPFSGVAGNIQELFYGPPRFRYIKSCQVMALRNCFLVIPPRVLETTPGQPDQILSLVFELDAAHGTPLGVNYDAELAIYVVIVQETT